MHPRQNYHYDPDDEVLASDWDSDARLLRLAMRAFRIDQSAPNAREQLRRELLRISRSKKRGRKSEDFHLVVEMASAGIRADQSAPAAAKALLKHRGKTAGLEGLIQKIRRHRRKYAPPTGGRNSE